MLVAAGPEKQHLVIQHCTGGTGDEFFQAPVFCSNTFVKDCISAEKFQIFEKRFWRVISKRVERFLSNFQEIFKIISIILQTYFFTNILSYFLNTIRFMQKNADLNAYLNIYR